MRAKKLLVVFLAAFCMLAVLLSCVFIFSVERINVTYAVGDQTDVSEFNETLEKYKGKNLLFVDLEDIKQDLKSFPYFEIEEITKSYPNVINVKIKERLEVYWLESDGVYYTLDQTGFVLKSETQKPTSNNQIQLTFDENVSFESLTVGEVVKTNEDGLIQSVFSMAQSVRLTDCINKISVFSKPEKDVSFYTYTGVVITIRNVEHLGKDKAIEAFNFYDNLDDYSKAFNEIIGFYNEYLGKVDADWSENLGGANE